MNIFGFGKKCSPATTQPITRKINNKQNPGTHKINSPETSQRPQGSQKDLKVKAKSTPKQDVFTPQGFKIRNQKDLNKQLRSKTNPKNAPLSNKALLKNAMDNDPVIKEITEKINPKTGVFKTTKNIEKKGIKQFFKAHKVASGIIAASLAIGGFLGFKAYNKNKKSNNA